MRTFIKIRQEIKNALVDLEPHTIKVRPGADKENSDVLYLLVISEKFKGVRLLKRFRMVGDLLEENARGLTENYSFVFETVTKKEFETKITEQPKENI